MEIKIDKNDVIRGNIELSRTLVTEALIYPQEETRAKNYSLLIRI